MSVAPSDIAWRRWILPVAAIGVWEAAARLHAIDPLLLPAPSSVLARLATLLRAGRLLPDLLASAWRVGAGFTIAWGIGIPLGVALGLSPILEDVAASSLSVLRPLSPPAWIPLAVLWFGIGDAPAVFIVAIGTALPLTAGALAATRGVDPLLVKASLTLGASRLQAVRHVILPALVPDLLAQTRIGLGLAWMCVIASEMVAVRHGLGFRMAEARSLFRTDDVLAGMLVIGLVGLGTDRLVAAAERRLTHWAARVELSRAGPAARAGA